MRCCSSQCMQPELLHQCLHSATINCIALGALAHLAAPAQATKHFSRSAQHISLGTFVERCVPTCQPACMQEVVVVGPGQRRIMSRPAPLPPPSPMSPAARQPAPGGAALPQLSSSIAAGSGLRLVVDVLHVQPRGATGSSAAAAIAQIAAAAGDSGLACQLTVSV